MNLTESLNLVSQNWYVPAMGLLVLVDFISGVGSAWLRKTFSWQHLADIFPHNVLTLVLATAAQVLSAMQSGSLDQYLTPAIFAIFAGTLLKSIWDNAQEILATLPKTAPPAKPA